ncbi:MAG: Gfo/Idh/MocA family oxidoreductase [Planctomycetes bacterium]|nr:Gfo/Idh/MocA family oxidoreductase [Planctomycetota bacterium]
MSEKKIRIGFVGVGQIAQAHLQTYEDIDGAEIVALTDINEGLLKRVAGERNIESTYTDFREMLKRDDIDAVDVCLHNNMHMPVTVAALEAGKDVYCEKPMAGSYRDAATMLDTAQQTGRKLSIQLRTIFDPTTRVSKAMIEKGMLGRVYHARSMGYRRRGRPYVDGYGTSSFVQKDVASGGALYDMGVYHIAQMLYLMGNPEVTRVTGKTYQETAMDPARREKSGYNVEELGLGFVNFADGATLDIIESWAVHMDQFESSSIFGSEGGLRLDPLTYFHLADDLVMDSCIDVNGAMYREKNVRGMGDEYDGPQHHWIAALQGRTPLLPIAEIALNTMLISEGIYRSSAEGRDVSADEIRKGSISSAVSL